jgi:hypothetical protein
MNQKFNGGEYVPSMHRNRRGDGRRSGIDDGSACGVHRQVSKVVQSEGSQFVSKKQGEMKWQQATRKGISQ